MAGPQGELPLVQQHRLGAQRPVHVAPAGLEKRLGDHPKDHHQRPQTGAPPKNVQRSQRNGKPELDREIPRFCWAIGRSSVLQQFPFSWFLTKAEKLMGILDDAMLWVWLVLDPKEHLLRGCSQTRQKKLNCLLVHFPRESIGFPKQMGSQNSASQKLASAFLDRE